MLKGSRKVSLSRICPEIRYIKSGHFFLAYLDVCNLVRRCVKGIAIPITLCVQTETDYLARPQIHKGHKMAL